ncbi:hypothetical protein [Agromyces sp. LHK192]|uniref:hypothetical protein n=1 Tax=Agromyces sp. LHK192 TaxID=2498704 RepID=UPI000FDA3632|nr:hypothetical protein [Agromyces sp. LHK192]
MTTPPPGSGQPTPPANPVQPPPGYSTPPAYPTQPGYPAQPGYPTQPGYPGAPVGYGPPATPRPTPQRSPLALTAVIAGAISTLVGSLVVLSYPVLLQGEYSYTLFTTVQWVSNTLIGLLGLVALATGVISLVRREPARALAGAGTALGAAAVFGILTGLLQGLIALF